MGRGGIPVASLAGYCVGDVYSEKHGGALHSARDILLKANGASDYGNKFGELTIGGFCRHYRGKLLLYREKPKKENGLIQ